ncbi:MAG: Ku protein [Bacteroidia bacterium]|nr:Ku protein [Methylotenera sp.]
MAHAIWKGAITFGLVHVPIALYTASDDISVDFDWLDKSTMDPVGYKRVNKRTGKEITKENIVKGIKQENDKYVLISEEEIKAAFPKSTQMIEIESFVKAGSIALMLLEQPYYLEPTGQGSKVYALLRETMLSENVVGVAKIVIHTKEHLAILIPKDDVLILNTIRWIKEIRSFEELSIPEKGKTALKPNDLKMATQLIKDMTTKWDIEQYIDTFTPAIQKLVDKKIKAGNVATVEPLEESYEVNDSNIADLTDLLMKSLAGNKKLTESK